MKAHLSSRSTVLSLACLTWIAANAGAQSAAPAANHPGVKSQAGARPAAAPLAAHRAAPSESGTRLVLQVTGLTAENSDKVCTALGAIQISDFGCQHCHYHQATAGKCPTCSAELKSEKEALFGTVRPAAESHTLALTLAPQHPTRLADIQNALHTSGMTLEPEKLALAGHTSLAISGGTADGVAALEKTLKEAKLFESVQISWDAGAKMLRATTHAGTAAPSYGRTKELLQTMKLRLDDVVWNPTVPAKA